MLSKQFSSVRKSDLRGTLGSDATFVAGALAYSTIGNDRGTPELQQERQRPAPGFSPRSSARPAALKTYKPTKPDGPPKPLGLASSRNRDLVPLHMAKDRRHTVDPLRGTIHEAAEEMERMSLQFAGPPDLGLGGEDSPFRDT